MEKLILYDTLYPDRSKTWQSSTSCERCVRGKLRTTVQLCIKDGTTYGICCSKLNMEFFIPILFPGVSAQRQRDRVLVFPLGMRTKPFQIIPIFPYVLSSLI